MDVFDFLPKSVFAKYLKRIIVMMPDGMLVISIACLAAEFEQGTLETIGLQVLDTRRAETPFSSLRAAFNSSLKYASVWA